MTETPEQQPRIPGVRYRTETRTRQVPSQVFGDEVMDEEEYKVDVPIPPRNWDAALMRFLMTVAIGSTAVAVVWSTASISRLLGLVVTTTAIAVAAASLFELLWIVCLVAEWLLRGQPDRAKPMKKAGWFAVVFVVAAVVVEGIHEDQVAAGIVGGAVSLMAKGAWWVVFRVRQVKLRRALAMWLQGKLEDTSAVELLLAYQHSIGGRQAYAALAFGDDEFRAAQGAVLAAQRVQEIPAAPAVQSAPVVQSAPLVPPVPPGSGPAPTSTPAPVQAPAPSPSPAPAPAAQVPPAAPAAPTAGPAPQAQPAPHPTAPVPPVQPAPTQLLSIAAATRQVLADKGEGISDKDLIDEVAKLVGKERAEGAKFPETVLRNRRTKTNTRKRQGRTAP
ncbi:hypothetical protein [Streptomyces sp. NPDC018693]|uniref:hypothetical protein n=1 Tax=unclassified Streptomyces TaxID=2593676 RepID=UPI0037912527